MPISFDNIPAALRLPGVYIEFNNELAGNAVVDFKLLVVGQRLANGAVLANVPIRVTSYEQAENYFGRGSMLAEMFRAIKDVDTFMETWAIALDDDAAGVQAAGTITSTGPATAAGTLNLYIGGKRVKVAVAVADSADAIATAIAAAITADTTLPVTAVVNGGTTNQVDITARHKGESGNDIDLRMNYYGETLPAGVDITFGAMAGGATNPDVSTAIAAMGDEWYNWMVMPFTDAANMVLLETELESRWGPMKQIGSRAFTAFNGTHAETGTFGNTRNSPHVTCMGTNKSPTPPYIFAAINAIVGVTKLSIDPARPLQTLKLTGVMAPKIEDRFTNAERNLLLFDGIATYTAGKDGSCYIERQVTMYQTNANGIGDDSYLDINTPETLERIRYDQRSRFLQKYPRHKLAEDDARFGAGQAMMQPKIAKAELLALYADFEDKGWCQDYEGYKASLVVEINADNPSRLDVLDSPKLVGQYRTHAQKTQFRR